MWPDEVHREIIHDYYDDNLGRERPDPRDYTSDYVDWHFHTHRFDIPMHDTMACRCGATLTEDGEILDI